LHAFSIFAVTKIINNKELEKEAEAVLPTPSWEVKQDSSLRDLKVIPITMCTLWYLSTSYASPYITTALGVCGVAITFFCICNYLYHKFIPGKRIEMLNELERLTTVHTTIEHSTILKFERYRAIVNDLLMMQPY
jgi:hypothetical protein